MVIKEADDRSGDIAELNRLIDTPTLSTEQKTRIGDELRQLEIGAWGEHQAAYFLNFYYEKSKAHLLLHDLRIVLSDGRVAQIDHLLVNSFQDVYLLESKNWARLTVDKMGACTTGGRRIIGVESPLEQCKRHAQVLRRAFEIDPQLKSLAPRVKILPRVLLAPRCHLKAPDHTEWYVKADIFHSHRTAEIKKISMIENLFDLPRYMSEKNLSRLGAALLELHNPRKRNWMSKFGIVSLPDTSRLTASQFVASIPGLVKSVPEYGEDWFVLRGKPDEETKRAIKRAGYRAEEKNGKWYWRLKK